jgi:tetratricopeptide (TPR) repeat protein
LLLLLSFVVGDVGPTMAHLAVGGLPHGRLTELQHARLGLARQLNPAQPAYDSRQAEALIDHEGDWDPALYAAAREAAEQAVRLHPTEAAYEWGLARVEALGCLRLFRDAATRERALTHFERAHQRSPADARIAIDAGEFLLSAADPHRARRLAERALRIEPNAVPARLLLAEALLDSGEPDAGPRAEALLAEALELAARWEAVAARGRYQAEMLSVDPARADRIQGKAAALHLSPPG